MWFSNTLMSHLAARKATETISNLEDKVDCKGMALVGTRYVFVGPIDHDLLGVTQIGSLLYMVEDRIMKGGKDC